MCGKHSELEDGNPLKVYKGRAVFFGDRVKDGWGNAAVFEELSSSPASMEAGKICDVWGCVPGHSIQAGDGTQAYCQSKLRGKKKTWVRLPKNQWPKGWNGVYDDPVVPLERALYGHPDSGGFWELHCEECVATCGFKPIGESLGWRSCFFNERLQCVLTIYVDDFKLAGPTENLAEAWELLKTKITIGETGPVDTYLGCKHRNYSREVKVPKTPARDIPDDEAPPAGAATSATSDPTEFINKSINIMEYDMESFLLACVETYEKLAEGCGAKVKWDNASTPFLDETQESDRGRDACKGELWG